MSTTTGMPSVSTGASSNGMPSNTNSGSMENVNYGGMVMPPIPTSPLWTPRLTPEVYVAIQFLMMGVAILTAGARTYLRIKKFRRVTVDDGLLTLAVCFLVVSVSVTYQATSMAYWSTYVNLHLAEPPMGWPDMIISFSIMDNISTIFGWGAIFIVKISFLMFLRSLTTRVRLVHHWWWFVFIVILMSTPVTMFLGFYICPNFTPSSISTLPSAPVEGNHGLTHSENCGTNVVPRQITFLTINCVLDILSDTLILTIPCWLLFKVKIRRRRKIALGTVLCLSIFMVIVAIIRVALDRIQLSNGNTAPDTPWLCFWTNVEGAVAIIMVSLTAFRSMLGQEGVSKASDTAESNGTPLHKTSRASRASYRPVGAGPGAPSRENAPPPPGGWTRASSHSAPPTRDTAEPWTDPHLHSIRKEITIRTDFEAVYPPAPTYQPRLHGHRPSMDRETETFLSHSSKESFE